METDGLELDDFYMLHQFKPSKEDAVTYYLPRLLAGTPLPHGADRLIIRDADVYACEPKDLAARYAPVPSAVRTGDRFFFTACKHKSRNDNRIARGAGAGTWTVQSTEDIHHEGIKVGEARQLSFKKGKSKTTGWVMKEYRCLLPEAIVADGEKVLCKIHLAQHAPAAARQESDAYKLRQERAPAQQSETVTVSPHAHKRPAPVSAAADADPPCSKKMRTAASVPEPCPLWVTPGASVPVRVPVPAPEEIEYEDCPVWYTSAVPVSSPAASTEVPHAPEADDAMGGRLSFTMEELCGAQRQEQTLPVEADDFDWESLEREPVDLLLRHSDEDWGSEAQEEQTPSIEAENNIERIDVHQPAPSADWDLPEDLRSLLADYDDEEALLYKGCSFNTAAAGLHASSLQGFFSFGAVN